MSEPITAELATAMRTLIANPFLTVDTQPDAYRTLRRNADVVARWFASEPQWPITFDIDRSWIRLAKLPAEPDRTRTLTFSRSLSTQSNVTFRATARHWMYFTLIAVAADSNRPQTLLTELRDRVIDEADELDLDRPVDLTDHTERRLFFDAIEMHVAWRSLAVQDAEDVRGYVQSGNGEILFNIDHRLLAALYASPISPAEHDDLDAFLAGDPDVAATGSGDDLDRQAYRTRLIRTLIDRPSLCIDRADDSYAAYLRTGATAHARTLLAQLGFHVERRGSTMVAVDETGIASTKPLMAPRSNDAVAAVIICEPLADRMRKADSDDGRVPHVEVTLNELALLVDEILAAHPRWAKTARESSAACRDLAAAAADVLVEGGCLTPLTTDRWRIEPLVGRFNPTIGTPAAPAPTPAPDELDLA